MQLSEKRKTRQRVSAQTTKSTKSYLEKLNYFVGNRTAFDRTFRSHLQHHRLYLGSQQFHMLPQIQQDKTRNFIEKCKKLIEKL